MSEQRDSKRSLSRWPARCMPAFIAKFRLRHSLVKRQSLGELRKPRHGVIQRRRYQRVPDELRRKLPAPLFASQYSTVKLVGEAQQSTDKVRILGSCSSPLLCFAFARSRPRIEGTKRGMTRQSTAALATRFSVCGLSPRVPTREGVTLSDEKLGCRLHVRLLARGGPVSSRRASSLTPIRAFETVLDFHPPNPSTY